ncbi:hypothetical protein KIPB_005108 [Kipferlia bialata]|uniref:Uncharacterized protein n=1 Tax=Kipferlia bialata TaxID=797122 RepID=A0A9K3GIA2_9EUKA|nr:hypothetical protein KIPB_005108 [Kipferlia bialata]|eukprot:g5108.t1
MSRLFSYRLETNERLDLQENTNIGCNIIKVVMLVVLGCSYPAMMACNVAGVEGVTGKLRGSKRSLVVICLFSLTYLVAVLAPSISFVISLLSATAGTMIYFVLPGIVAIMTPASLPPSDVCLDIYDMVECVPGEESEGACPYKPRAHTSSVLAVMSMFTDVDVVRSNAGSIGGVLRERAMSLSFRPLHSSVRAGDSVQQRRRAQTLTLATGTASRTVRSSSIASISESPWDSGSRGRAATIHLAPKAPEDSDATHPEGEHVDSDRWQDVDVAHPAVARLLDRALGPGAEGVTLAGKDSEIEIEEGGAHEIPHPEGEGEGEGETHAAEVVQEMAPPSSPNPVKQEVAETDTKPLKKPLSSYILGTTLVLYGIANSALKVRAFLS